MNNLRHCSYYVLKKHRAYDKCMHGILKNTNVFEQYQLSNNFHNASPSLALLTCLKSRGLLRLQGPDTVTFLQGLVTNDVNTLMESESSLQYSFMLNVQGRILYDFFFYNVTEKDGSPCTLFIDVPALASGEIISILRKYKIRRKVDVSDVSDEYQVWSYFSPHTETGTNVGNIPSDAVATGPDPRVADFGRRLIRKSQSERKIDEVDESVYRESRYRWGLPEGIDDLPPGNCFPLESNGIFMNGVSFDKGCYLGQELTARTHHTGVTRKRLTPLVFSNVPPEIEKDATIQNEKGRNAGKIRGSQGSFGLGLVRLAYLKENLSISVNDDKVSLSTHIPHWWPELNL